MDTGFSKDRSVSGTSRAHLLQAVFIVLVEDLSCVSLYVFVVLYSWANRRFAQDLSDV